MPRRASYGADRAGCEADVESIGGAEWAARLHANVIHPSRQRQMAPVRRISLLQNPPRLVSSRLPSLAGGAGRTAEVDALALLYSAYVGMYLYVPMHMHMHRPTCGEGTHLS